MAQPDTEMRIAVTPCQVVSAPTALTTKPDVGAPPAPDLLGRRFDPDRPNVAWNPAPQDAAWAPQRVALVVLAVLIGGGLLFASGIAALVSVGTSTTKTTTKAASEPADTNPPRQ
ncbi:MAG TPA: hypothetical protein VKG45_12640, partial [Actinomycetes bacterium]|nr:hypothetical protein [Actinomycetes bacterium]